VIPFDPKQRATLAVHAVIAARAAAGEPAPAERIGHILMVDGWRRIPPPAEELEATDEERECWGEVIVAAAER